MQATHLGSQRTIGTTDHFIRCYASIAGSGLLIGSGSTLLATSLNHATKRIISSKALSGQFHAEVVVIDALTLAAKRTLESLIAVLHFLECATSSLYFFLGCVTSNQRIG